MTLGFFGPYDTISLVFPPSEIVHSSSRGMMLSTKSIIRRTFSPFGSCAGRKNISEALDSMAALERPAGGTKDRTSLGRVSKERTACQEAWASVGCVKFSGSRRPSSGVLMSGRGVCLRSFMDSTCSWSCRSAVTGQVADVILAHFSSICLRKAIFLRSCANRSSSRHKAAVCLLMPLFRQSPKVAGSTSDRGANSWRTFEFALAKFTCDSPLVLVERFTATGTPCNTLGFAIF